MDKRGWKSICGKCMMGEIEPKFCEYYGEPNGCNSPDTGRHPEDIVYMSTDALSELCEDINRYAIDVRKATDGCDPDVAENIAKGIEQLATRVRGCVLSTAGAGYAETLMLNVVNLRNALVKARARIEETRDYYDWDADQDNYMALIGEIDNALSMTDEKLSDTVIMRTTLEVLRARIKSIEKEYPMPALVNDLETLRVKCEIAMSFGPRNCDRFFSLEEAWSQWLKDHPGKETRAKTGTQEFLEWLFAREKEKGYDTGNT